MKGGGDMKRIAGWITIAAFVVFVVDWTIVGLRLLNGNYDITVGAYLGMACWVVMLMCILIRAFWGKCPHCGKSTYSGGQYCPHCGKRV